MYVYVCIVDYLYEYIPINKHDGTNNKSKIYEIHLNINTITKLNKYYNFN